jgi:excisionase family DNA binding protein
MNLDPETTPTCSMDVAAEALGLSRATVYRLARNGELPVIRLGGSLRVSTAELRRLCGMEPSPSTYRAPSDEAYVVGFVQVPDSVT